MSTNEVTDRLLPSPQGKWLSNNWLVWLPCSLSLLPIKLFHFVRLLRTPSYLLGWRLCNSNQLLLKQTLQFLNMPQFIFSQFWCQKRELTETPDNPQEYQATRHRYLLSSLSSTLNLSFTAFAELWTFRLHFSISFSGLGPKTGWSQSGSDLKTWTGFSMKLGITSPGLGPVWGLRWIKFCFKTEQIG